MRILLGLVLLCSPLLYNAELTITRTGKLDAARLAMIPQRMKVSVDRGEVNGVVTLIQHRGKLGSLEAVGWLDKEKQAPMRPDTIFQVMSMTKPVTSVAVMMLMEDGLLALTDPVQNYLPEFRGQMMIASRDKDSVTLTKPQRPITIRDLLTHTSGMPEMPPESMDGVGFYYNMKRPLTESVNLFSQMALLFEPGTKWSYSNTGMATLGRIIEVVGGKPYETFLAQRIFEPLGMRDSFFFPPADKYSRIAAGYQYEKGKLLNMGDAIYRKGAKYSMPEGGLYATAQDMAAFYQMMLDGGVAKGKRLLSKASVETMTMLHTPGMGRTFGLGWSVRHGAASTLQLESDGAYGHAGAFGTYGWVDPKKGLVGVFMVQNLGGGSEDALGAFVDLANASVVE